MGSSPMGAVGWLEVHSMKKRDARSGVVILLKFQDEITTFWSISRAKSGISMGNHDFCRIKYQCQQIM